MLNVPLRLALWHATCDVEVKQRRYELDIALNMVAWPGRKVLWFAIGIAAAAGLAYVSTAWMAQEAPNEPKVVWKAGGHRIGVSDVRVINGGKTLDEDRAKYLLAALETLCGGSLKTANWPQWIPEPTPAVAPMMVPDVVCQRSERVSQVWVLSR